MLAANNNPNTPTENRESPSKTKRARPHHRAGANLMNGASRLRFGGSRHRLALSTRYHQGPPAPCLHAKSTTTQMPTITGLRDYGDFDTTTYKSSPN